MRSYWIRVGAKSSQWLVSLYKAVHVNTHRDNQEMTKWSNPATNQGIPRIARSHQKLGSIEERCYSRAKGFLVLSTNMWSFVTATKGY